MPTQHDMGPDSEIYRAVLEYEYQPMRVEPNPHYDPHYIAGDGDTTKRPWSQWIQVPDGPEVTRERMIGPYQSITPIRSHITRNRDRHKNLRIKRIERVAGWVEVDDA